MKFSTKYSIATVRRYQMGSKECHINSLRKSDPCSVNVIITDIKMVDAPEQGLNPVEGEDLEMNEAPKERPPVDELDPWIIVSKPHMLPMEELECFSVNP